MFARRLRSITIVLILMASTLLSLVPTASATHTLAISSDLRVDLNRAGTPFTDIPNETGLVPRVGDVFSFSVTIATTGSCQAGSTRMDTVELDLSKIGGGSAEDMDKNGNSFTFNYAMAAGSLSGPADVTAQATTTCEIGGTSVDQTLSATTTSGSFTIDNELPSATITLAPPTPPDTVYGLGDEISYSVQTEAGNNVTFGSTAWSSTARTNSTTGNAGKLAVDRPNFDGAPTFVARIWDPAGNWAPATVTVSGVTIDTIPPNATMATAVARLGQFFDVSLDNDTDVVNLSISVGVGTPSTHAFSGSPLNYTRAGLTPNTAYSLSVTPIDKAGNEAGPFTVAAKTAPNLGGKVTLTGSGSKIGGTLTATPSATLANNVSTITLDVSQFGAGPLVWTLPDLAAKSFIINDGAENPVAGVTFANGAFSFTGNRVDASAISVDALAPPVPSDLAARVNGAGDIEMSWSNTGVDVADFRVEYVRDSDPSSLVSVDLALANTSFTIVAARLVQDVPYTVRLIVVDDAGNEATSADIPVVSTLQPIFADLDTPTALKTLGLFSGSWSTADSTGASNVNITLNLTSGTQHWNDVSGGFVSDQAYVNAMPAADGTWAWTYTQTPPQGTYKLYVNATNNFTGVMSSQQYSIVIDTTEPTVTVTNIAALQSDKGGSFTISISDASGLATFAVALKAGTSNLDATGTDGAVLNVTCPSASCSIASWAPPVTTGSTTATFDLGKPDETTTYRMVASGSDRAGNSWAKTVASNVEVQPRVAIKESGDLPRLDADDKLIVLGYAAMDRSSGSCVGVCRVDRVKYEARAGTSGAGTLLATIAVDAGGPTTSGSPDGFSYFNYTPPQPLSVGSLDTSALMVRAIAEVSVAGTTRTSATPWIPVRTALVPSGLIVVNPVEGASIYNKTSGAQLIANFTYQQSGLVGSPSFNYTVRSVATGLYVDPVNGAVSANPSATSRSLTAAVAGSIYYFNQTGSAFLPRGEYRINASFTSSAGVAETTRRFFVDTTPLGFAINDSASQIYGGRFVGGAFRLALEVYDDNASIAASDLSFALLGTDGGVLPASSYSVVTRPITRDPLGNQSHVLLDVTLPSTATDQSRYLLNVTISSDLLTSDSLRQRYHDGSAANATRQLALTVDKAKPSGLVDKVASQALLTAPSSSLAIVLGATDAASGAAKVEARVIDKTTGKTLDPFFGFLPGDLQKWLSSTPRSINATHEQIEIVPGTSAGTYRLEQIIARRTKDTHAAATGLPIAFEPDHLYFVEVRVTDRVGFVSTLTNATFRFDAAAPTLSTFRLDGSSALASRAWHVTTGNFTVLASDNACLARVTLLVETPSPYANRTVDFPRPTGATCTAGRAASASQTWRLPLKDNPLVTDVVGRNNYTIEAFDKAGNKVNITTPIRVDITDTVAPSVRFLTLRPTVAPVGAPVNLDAEVFENDQVANVRATLYRVLPDRNELITTGVMDFASVNYADHVWKYTISTDGGFDDDLSLEVGDYLFQVRATDVSNRVSADSNIILRVISEGVPVTSLDSPANGTLVGARPTFTLRALGSAIEQSGITLRAGTSLADLTAVTGFNTTAITLANGSRSGWTVKWTPTADLPEVENYTVQISAAATNGLTNTTTYYFDVDATLPTVNVTLAGTVDIDGVEWATAATTISAQANDSRLTPVAIRLVENGGAEKAYTGPFAPSGSAVDYIVNIIGVDGAGNRNVSTLALKFDATAPRITTNTDGDEPVVTIVENGVGLDEGSFIVHYAYGNDAFATMALTKVTGNTYKAALGGDAATTGLRYYFTAADRLGNAGTLHSQAAPHVISADSGPVNTPPTVRITSPADGAKLTATTTVAWTSDDADGDALTVSIVLSGAADITLETDGADDGTYSLDIARLTAGTYTLTVTVDDGTDEGSDSINFEIGGRTDPQPNDPVTVTKKPPATLEPGASFPIQVKIDPGNKTIATVSYSLVRADGSVAATGSMTFDGTEWGASVTPPGAGTYSVKVTTVFTDGSSSEAKDLGPVIVSKTDDGGSSVGAGTPVGFPVLIVAALATIGLAAFGAFGRWRQ